MPSKLRAHILIKLALVALAACACEAAVGGVAEADPGDSAIHVACPPATAPEINLLCNPSFEAGVDTPCCWRVSTGHHGVSHSWQRGFSHSGAYSVVVHGVEEEVGWWQQSVAVQGGRLYQLTGHVGFDEIAAAGRCYLQLRFSDATGAELQTVDLPHHRGTRELALDFPPGLKVRAPDQAHSVEVRLVLEGAGNALFDDITLAPVPTGRVSGVVEAGGAPLADAQVRVLGPVWGRDYVASSDGQGRFAIDDLPLSAPRYVLVASKQGFRSRSRGEVAVLGGGETEVDFELAAGSDPLEPLRVAFGSLVLSQHAEPAPIPESAVIPTDSLDYPATVRPFLDRDEVIDPADEAVSQRALAILGALPEPQRHRTRALAWAVYTWLVRNIEHDSIYASTGSKALFQDPTSSSWQAVDGGWAWGRSLAEWLQRPAELLETRSGLASEHALLACALLRALQVPCRSFSGALELWAQPGDGEGAWHGLDTALGRVAFREEGHLGAGFDRARLISTPVTPAPVLHQSFDAETPGLWREVRPFHSSYPATPEGLALARADLDGFAASGEVAQRQTPPQGPERYLVHYRDVTIGLGDLVNQTSLRVRFPLVTEGGQHQPTGDDLFWTSHPDCVRHSAIEVLDTPYTEGQERWFVIDFDLGSLLDPGQTL